jgi:hypothetical protein
VADKTWKRVEREKCRQLGGERSGPTGRDDPVCKDIPLIGMEIKAYKRLVFLTEDWNQAVENAAKYDLIPVLNVREGGRGGRDQVRLTREGWWALETLAGPSGPDGTGGGHPFKYDARSDFVRMEWDDFLRLYLAATSNIKELHG